MTVTTMGINGGVVLDEDVLGGDDGLVVEYDWVVVQGGVTVGETSC